MRLYKRGKLYYYRVRVPADLRALLKCNEVVRSLKTRRYRDAYERARVLDGEVARTFNALRQERFMDRAYLKKLVQQHAETVLKDAAEDYHTAPMLSVERHTSHVEALEGLRVDYREALARRDYECIERDADEFVRERGLEIESGSADWRLLCSELLKVGLAVLDLELLKAFGDEPVVPPLVQPVGAVQGIATGQPPVQGARLSEVICEYLEDGANAWTPKTASMNRAILGVFAKVVGDIAVGALGYPEIRHFKETLGRVPSNMSKHYPGKSLEQVLALKGVEGMSTKNINKYLQRVSAFFNFAIRNGYTTLNPSKGMKIRESKKRADKERPKFSARDMRALFESPQYAELRHKHPHRFWLPLIGAFSGARLEELAQLHKSDLREIDGVWCLDINAKGEKRLKTATSERVIPLHPVLIDLGLLNYHATVRHTRLWPRLKRGRDGYGQAISRWFGRFKAKVGVSPGVTFHSFRHSVADCLKQDGVSDVAIADLLGHEHFSLSVSRYGKQLQPRNLLKVVKRVQYAVDLSHLIE